MTIAIRYYTRSGNTKALAHAIADAVCVPACDLAEPLEERVDVLFLGCSYYAFDVDEAVKAFLKQNRDKIGCIALFGTSAMMKSVKKPVGKVTCDLGLPLSEEEFHCRGKFGPIHKNHPNAQDLDAVRAFAKRVIEKGENS